VVSFTLLPLYLRGQNPRYPLDRRLRGPQSWSGRRGEQKILEPTGTRTPTPRSSSPWPVAIPTALSRLGILGFNFLLGFLARGFHISPLSACCSETPLTYSVVILKIIPFTKHTSPLSVQALQSRSCPSYISYATTAAWSLERSQA
jgi:hypothetical protein